MSAVTELKYCSETLSLLLEERNCKEKAYLKERFDSSLSRTHPNTHSPIHTSNLQPGKIPEYRIK